MRIIEKSMMKVDMPAASIWSLLKWIAGLSIFFLLGTCIYHTTVSVYTGSTSQLLLLQLNLALENVVATTYSSMLLLFAGVLAWCCYEKDRQNTSGAKLNLFDFGWLVVAAAFVTLSFDEMGSFHESIGDSKLFKGAGGGSKSGWYVFYVVGLSVAVFMGLFFLKKIKVNRNAMLLSVLGMLLLLSNPLQEKFEWYSWRKAGLDPNWHRPVFFLLLEEGSELFAELSFIVSLLLYSAGTNSFKSAPKPLQLAVPLNKKFLSIALGVFILTGVGMFIIYFNAWHIKQDDSGKPQNWPPSAFAFVAFLLAICRYIYFKTKNETESRVFIVLSVTSLFASFYFGADIYNYEKTVLTLLPYVLMALALWSGGLAFAKLNNVWCRICLILWCAGIAASVFMHNHFYRPFSGFVAFAFLIAAIAFHYCQSKKVTA